MFEEVEVGDIVGTCSLCGGPVVYKEGINERYFACEHCDASPKQNPYYGPIIEMDAWNKESDYG